MTAEGDNSVLMQKVAKERLAKLQKEGFGNVDAPDSKDMVDSKLALYHLRIRDQVLFKELAQSLAKAGKAKLFETWMLEESDLIQGAARAYADLLVAEQ